MFRRDHESQADLVDSLVVGFISAERAQAIAAQYPDVTASIASWIREAATAQNWRRVERLANLAAPLRAPGLGEVRSSLSALPEGYFLAR